MDIYLKALLISWILFGSFSIFTENFRGEYKRFPDFVIYIITWFAFATFIATPAYIIYAIVYYF